MKRAADGRQQTSLPRKGGGFQACYHTLFVRFRLLRIVGLPPNPLLEHDSICDANLTQWAGSHAN